MSRTWCFDEDRAVSRRTMLRQAAAGFGGLALAGLAAEPVQATGSANPLAPRSPLRPSG